MWALSKLYKIKSLGTYDKILYQLHILFCFFSPPKTFYIDPLRGLDFTWPASPHLLVSTPDVFILMFLLDCPVTFLSLSLYFSDAVCPLSHLNGASWVTFLVNGSATESVFKRLLNRKVSFLPVCCFCVGGSAEAHWSCFSSPQ